MTLVRGSVVKASSGPYLGPVEQHQHLVQRPPLSGQLLPQSVGGGGSGGGARVGAEVKVHRTGEAVDGAVGQEVGRSRFSQQRTLGERAT